MDWDEIERNWTGLKGEVKDQWSKLTDEDVEFVKGKYAGLLCLLQERYGHAKEQAEQEINDWAKRLKVDIVAELTALRHDVARLSASVEVELVCEPAFDYGRVSAQWTTVDDDRHAADASGAGQTIRLRSDLALGIEGNSVRARHLLGPGDRAYCALSWAEGLAAPQDTDEGDALTPLDLEARAFDAALRNAFTLSKRWLAAPPVEMKSLVLDIVERVTIAANRIVIWLNRAKIAAALEAGGGSQRPDIDPITLSIEAKLRRAGKGKRLVIANGAEAEVNAGLVELIKEAFAIRIQLLSGSDDSIEAMSGRLGMNKCRLTSLIRLSYLAPDIVRALLEGRQPIELTPTRLLRLSKDLPHDWSEQRHVLDFAA